MSRSLRSDSGRLEAVQQEDVSLPEHPHGNFVVTDDRGRVVLDEWSFFADQTPPPSPSRPDPLLPIKPSQPVKVDGPFAPRFYSYWANAVVLNGITYLFAGHKQLGPTFYSIKDGHVTALGSLHVWHGGETECWTWTKGGRILLPDGPRYRSVDPFTGIDNVIFDISESHPRHVLWQTHSSDDEQVHSATIRQMDEPWADVGALFVIRGNMRYFDAQGRFDECQVDKSGRFGLIKESFHRQGEPEDKWRLDNRFIDFQTGRDEWMRDEDGAFGHSDMGHGIIIGEDDQIGAVKWMDLATREQRILKQPTWNMGHMSIRGDRYLLSDATDLNLSLLNGGVQVVYNHGVNPGKDYDRQVRANLSPCGTRVAFMMEDDAYVLELED